MVFLALVKYRIIPLTYYPPVQTRHLHPYNLNVLHKAYKYWPLTKEETPDSEGQEPTQCLSGRTAYIKGVLRKIG